MVIGTCASQPHDPEGNWKTEDGTHIVFRSDAPSDLKEKVQLLDHLAQNGGVNPPAKDCPVQVYDVQVVCALVYPALCLGQGIVQGHNLSARHPPHELHALAAAQVDGGKEGKGHEELLWAK